MPENTEDLQTFGVVTTPEIPGFDQTPDNSSVEYAISVGSTLSINGATLHGTDTEGNDFEFDISGRNTVILISHTEMGDGSTVIYPQEILYWEFESNGEQKTVMRTDKRVTIDNGSISGTQVNGWTTSLSIRTNPNIDITLLDEVPGTQE